jgi:hypothetical protein
LLGFLEPLGIALVALQIFGLVNGLGGILGNALLGQGGDYFHLPEQFLARGIKVGAVGQRILHRAQVLQKCCAVCHQLAERGEEQPPDIFLV